MHSKSSSLYTIHYTLYIFIQCIQCIIVQGTVRFKLVFSAASVWSRTKQYNWSLPGTFPPTYRIEYCFVQYAHCAVCTTKHWRNIAGVRLLAHSTLNLGCSIVFCSASVSMYTPLCTFPLLVVHTVPSVQCCRIVGA